MKVPSDRSSAPPASRTGSAPASDSKSFDKVLESKTEDGLEKKARGQRQKLRQLPEHESGQAAGGPLAFATLPDWGPAAVATPAPVADVRPLDGLVREILVVAGPGVDPKVEIQFQSKTLEGLNVRIERKGDEIAIRFLTGSESVARLLSQNVDQLTQSLHSKGLHLAPVQVEFAPVSPRSTGSDHNPRDGRRGRGEERQDQGKRQR
jgi:flagellar hook-length control protein FliK